MWMANLIKTKHKTTQPSTYIKIVVKNFWYYYSKKKKKKKRVPVFPFYLIFKYSVSAYNALSYESYHLLKTQKDQNKLFKILIAKAHN